LCSTKFDFFDFGHGRANQLRISEESSTTNIEIIAPPFLESQHLQFFGDERLKVHRWGRWSSAPRWQRAPMEKIYVATYPNGISRFSSGGELLDNYRSASLMFAGWIQTVPSIMRVGCGQGGRMAAFAARGPSAPDESSFWVSKCQAREKVPVGAARLEEVRCTPLVFAHRRH